ncbi:MAG TPA: 6-phosphogluconolactonase [Gemmatimonadaceae bacterium]|nr:6-phosphogluconolactonase [Gemmatimonadaceae bacterium]
MRQRTNRGRSTSRGIASRYRGRHTHVMSGPYHRPRADRVLVCEASDFAGAAARHVASVVQGAVRARGRCALALTGGSTPRPIYELMAVPPIVGSISWDRVDIYFGDERCVPPDDQASNYRMAHEALLQHVLTPGTSVHRMEGERTDREAAARDYARLLPARLDVLLLGMGEDGHTASLFPHSPALRESARKVVPASGPEPEPLRLTITPPVIADAETVIVVVAGSAKAGAVALALEGPYQPEQLPIQFALSGTWFVDHPAAGALRGHSLAGAEHNVTGTGR